MTRMMRFVPQRILWLAHLIGLKQWLWIKNAVVWNLVDDAGYQGQAACFTEWEFH
ncbi:MAG: MEKHLA domain-containing protein [Methylococcaceae bacterium]|nr:MEKHLA domain-containing protein [Methylococcaceae bacterium]MDP3904545.1 MEKHLA domain-containing protein [Methylococcaceae bacterium]